MTQDQGSKNREKFQTNGGIELTQDQGSKNMDKEVWRQDVKDPQDPDNFYSPYIRITAQNEISIGANGRVATSPPKKWVELAWLTLVENKFMVEQLASLSHQVWAHWMKYLFSVSIENPDGSVTIPADKVERWQRQMKTSYHDLTEKEQEFDIEQALKYESILYKKSS